MGRRARLDAELVRRGLARSRVHAAELVAERRVKVGGLTATKPATGVDMDTPLLVAATENEPHWVSRGARKLLGALDDLVAGGPPVAGRRCLDAGASTGGFTDVLLRAGAAAAEIGTTRARIPNTALTTTRRTDIPRTVTVAAICAFSRLAWLFRGVTPR